MYLRPLRYGLGLLIVTMIMTISALCENTSPIIYYDMMPLFQLDLKDSNELHRFYDETLLVSALQGLVNRDQPQLYIRYIADADDFWWQRMTDEKGWLYGRDVVRIETLEDLLQRFSSTYQGLVVWDERVPATSNLAATLAGSENLLPIRYDENPVSIYQQFIANHPSIPIKITLMNPDGSPLFTGQGTIPETTIPSTGSAKCDAYRWLIEHSVKTGKTNPQLMGYYLDAFWFKCWFVSSPQNHTLTNLDFIIANRGVCFDLNVWTDEAPVDDPNQSYGTDEKTLKELLRAMYDQFQGDGMIHAAGFTPWAYKYTDYHSDTWNAGGKHGGVPTEWKYAEILSCYNAYMDADALGLSAMANASFFQHLPLPEFIPQNPKPTVESLKKQGILDTEGRIVSKHYVAHYVGDYDSAAWLYQMLPRMWNDENRGKVPLSWAFNPNLAVRFPVGMLWSRQNRTANDFFVAGDSGAGYLNPGMLSEPRSHSGLPSGVGAWEKHCAKYFKQWDLSLTGFVIDGNGPGLSPEGLDSYARFSSDGIVPQKIPQQGVHQGMPYVRMSEDLPGYPEQAARVINGRGRAFAPRFSVFRSILQTPSWYLKVSESLNELAGDSVRIVDLYTLLWLVREYENHPERYPKNDSSLEAIDEIRATPSEKKLLQAVYASDGPFEIVNQSDRSCWSMPRHVPPHYLYFDVVDYFYKAGSGSLQLQVTYWDRGTDPFYLQYDSTDRSTLYDGVYKQSPEKALRTNSGTWRTALFQLDDARFKNNQNSGTDFRLYNPGDDLIVSEIKITRIKESR